MSEHSLMIIDWDDTLFPTSWIVQKDIDLHKKRTRDRYAVFFAELDNILCRFLMKLLNMSKVVIVTNASMKWIEVSSKIVPNTSNLINKYIEVISARDIHQEEFPNNAHMWKEVVFRNLINIHFSKSKNVQNIMSVGDADYEYLALVKLYKYRPFYPKRRLLKAIIFHQSPTYSSLIDQIELLTKNLDKIVLHPNHLDLRFEEM
jgi:hypothetical protein